jgi:hypothetical protein
MCRRMEELALSFPTLEGRPGVTPWEPDELDQWASGPAPSHGGLCAARFVLAVWDPRHTWQCGRFDLMEALGCWDTNHRGAFVHWAGQPWWP